MSYFFLTPGVYEIAARFEEGGHVIAETSFVLPVKEAETSPGIFDFLKSPNPWIMEPLLLVVSFVLGIIARQLFFPRGGAILRE